MANKLLTFMSSIVTIRIKSAKCIIAWIFALIVMVVGFSVGASQKALIILGVSLSVLAPIYLNCSKKITEIFLYGWYLCSMPITVVLTQLLLNQKTFTIDIYRIFLGCVLVGVFINFLFLLTKSLRVAVLMGIMVLMLLTTANHFIFDFRGSELAPYDFLAINTAMQVAEKYQYSINAPFLYAWSLAGIYLLGGFCIVVQKKSVPSFQAFKIFSVLEGLLLVTFAFGIQTVDREDYRNDGTIRNGYLLNFVRRMESNSVKIPNGYSSDYIMNIEKSYYRDGTVSTEKPDIIVIMNESFSDLRIMGDLNTNIDIMPYYDSLLENSIHGYALASSIGGGTCNSEYQFLTGNSMAFLPNGAYPYQQYLKSSTYSMFAQMEKYGYQTIATHPEQAKNWMRATVYPMYGVDKVSFIDEYQKYDLIRQYVSDREMYEKVIDLYVEAQSSASVFLFGITMQNHGGYSDDQFIETVDLMSQEYPAAEQYLSLMRYSDAALEGLMEYFKRSEREIIVLFFGDHMPQLDAGFYEELHGGPFDTLEEQMLQYTVPFFIWANYDIEEQNVGLTSLNFLSNYVYEAAGLPLSAYNAFLKDIQQIIPAMNVFGYYSLEKGAFIPYEEAEGKEAEALNQYRILQYNSLFDKENRSQVFFPVPATNVS